MVSFEKSKEQWEVAVLKGIVILRRLSAVVTAGILLLGFGVTAAAEEAALETTGESQLWSETSLPTQPPETLPSETTAPPETTVQNDNTLQNSNLPLFL